MSLYTQLATSVEQPLSRLNLLLVDGLRDKNSSELVSKIEALDTAILETCDGVENLLEKVVSFRPDVLLMAVSSLQQSTLDELSQLHERYPLPVIVIAKHYARRAVETFVYAGVSSYLTGEVSTERLMVIVDLSVVRFKQEQVLKRELRALKEKLSDRKLIERAKGIIMQQKKINEDQAYSQMRKSAMDHGKSMADLAKQIISVFEMLD